MKMSVLFKFILAILAVIVIFPGVSQTPYAASTEIPDQVFERMKSVLVNRRISADSDLTAGRVTRGPLSLQNLYRKTVRSVPLVISNGSFGSSIVVKHDAKRSWALLISNQHVVSKPFFNKKGNPYVALVFYEPSIAGEIYDTNRLNRCKLVSFSGDWCRANKRSFRLAKIIGIDSNRDLSLLYVKAPPSQILALQEEDINKIVPGDDVAVIGHPEGALWSLTRGIVSAVRHRYPMNVKTRFLGTIIQTQAPISPGNSGGPLLSTNGRLMGVMTWFIKGSQGLNNAVGINEVVSFYSEQMRRLKKIKDPNKEIEFQGNF